MADSKDKKDYRDRSRINKNERYEVYYWTKKWKISSQQLHGAIRATGSTSVKSIEKYLKGRDII